MRRTLHSPEGSFSLSPSLHPGPQTSATSFLARGRLDQSAGFQQGEYSLNNSELSLTLVDMLRNSSPPLATTSTTTTASPNRYLDRQGFRHPRKSEARPRRSCLIVILPD